MSDEQPEPSEALDLVRRRIDYLELLSGEPRQPSDLVDSLEHSRSTVNRALRELEEAGFVERTAGGYASTTGGRLAARTVREGMTELDAIVDADALLNPLEPETELDRRALVGAEVTLVDGLPPDDALANLEDALATASEVRALLPLLPEPAVLEAIRTRVVDAGGSAEFVVEEALAETLLALFRTAGESSPTGNLDLRAGEVPTFGLFVVGDGHERRMFILVFTESRSLHGVLANDRSPAVEWAENWVERARKGARAVTDIPDSVDGPDEEGGPVRPSEGPEARPRRDDPDVELPVSLQEEGFELLSESYFERRNPAPPAVSWRAGLDLVEVEAGYALDRQYERDGERRSLTDDVVSGLREGVDHVVLGPPGSGKSTACKSVACRWYELGYGPVFYRTGGRGSHFESVATLGARLRWAEGHPLVVVEDAVDEETNAVFELMEQFRNDPEVTFLLDAPEREWNDPEKLPADARLRDYRKEAVETVTVPALDEVEAERFVGKFTDVVGDDLNVPVDELLSDIRCESADDRTEDGPRAGAVLLLFHRLASYTDPLSRPGEESPTTLTEDVRRTYDALDEAGDAVLDVGIAANLLNASGVGVRPELVFALASRVDAEAVRTALDQLEGRVLFPADGDHDVSGSATVLDSRPEFRTVHESWSVAFLDYLRQTAGDRSAHERLGRCVTAILSLATDRARRERIDWELAGEAPYLAEIEADPSAWAEEFLRQVFELGLENPVLAPLFGRTGYSAFDPPDVCSPVAEVRCAYWRGRMYLNGGDFDAADREFEAVRDLLADRTVPGDREVTELEAASLRNQGEVAFKRREYDAAEQYVWRALELDREIGNERGEANDLRILGIIGWLRGDMDTAERRFARSLRRHREAGDRSGEAKSHNNLGLVARRRGRLDDAEDHLRRSLDIKEEVGTRQEQSKTLNNLGLVARDRGQLDAAEEYFARSLEYKRHIGDVQGEANTLTNLSILARRADDLEAAREYAELAIDVYGEVDDPQGEADSLRALAEVTLARGDPGTAAQYAERSLERYRDIGDRRGEGRALRTLGRVDRERGSTTDAADRLSTSRELLVETGTERDRADTRRELALVAVDRGDLDRAAEHLDAAVGRYRDMAATEAALTAIERVLEAGERRGDVAEEWDDRVVEIADRTGLELDRESLRTRVEGTR